MGCAFPPDIEVLVEDVVTGEVVGALVMADVEARTLTLQLPVTDRGLFRLRFILAGE